MCGVEHAEFEVYVGGHHCGEDFAGEEWDEAFGVDLWVFEHVVGELSLHGEGEVEGGEFEWGAWGVVLCVGYDGVPVALA